MKKAKWTKDGFTQVSLVCGVFFIFFLYFFMTFTYGTPLKEYISRRINNVKEVKEKEESNRNEVKYPDMITAAAGISANAVFYFLGFCIYCIRENGFTYYTRYTRERNERCSKKNIFPNGIILPGLIQQILFYVFRKGSVVEECCDNVKTKYDKIRTTLERTDLTKKQRQFFSKVLKKEDRVFYDWIQRSKNPVKDLRVLAQKIDDKKPECQIYEFFCKSQLYQGLDTGSLLLTLICVISFLINIILRFLFSYDLPYIQPLLMGIIPFILHLFSKRLSTQKANMYMEKIDDILTEYPRLLSA